MRIPRAPPLDATAPANFLVCRSDPSDGGHGSRTGTGDGGEERAAGDGDDGEPGTEGGHEPLDHFHQVLGDTGLLKECRHEQEARNGDEGVLVDPSVEGAHEHVQREVLPQEENE